MATAEGRGDFFQRLRSGHRITRGICVVASLLGLRHILPPLRYGQLRIAANGKLMTKNKYKFLIEWV